MKRIVQCPNCEAKLAVFDLGKAVSKKCPRCGTAFDIPSEEGKSAEEKPAAAEPAKAEPAAPAPAAAEKPAEKPAETPAEKKEITVKKPIGKPTAPTAPKTTAPTVPASSTTNAELPPPSGVSFLHVIVLFGLLILSLILQVMSSKKAEARFNAVDNQLQAIRSQLQSVMKK